MKRFLSVFFILVAVLLFTSCGGGGGGAVADSGDTSALKTYYLDADGDGYGDINNPIEDYTRPAGYVTGSNDCDDSDPEIHPKATEVCDGIDNDCDGEIDEGFDDSCRRTTYYLDADGDGYGDPGYSTESYTQPAGYVLNNNDCDDFDADVNPSATEICDKIDNDCDGEIDEGFNDSCTKITFYRDYDDDGYGDSGDSVEDYNPPAGYVANDTDCNDDDPDIHPGATEACNDIDDNCNTEVDEGFNDLCQYVVTLYAVADSYVSSRNATTNYGGVSTIYTGEKDASNLSSDVRGFVKFDLSSIPSDATIVDAIFEIKTILHLDSVPFPATVSVYQTSGGDWGELTLTYNNMPTGSTQSTSKYWADCRNSIVLDFDLINFVTSWLGGADNYGLRIESDVSTSPNFKSLVFYSREWDSSSGPRLTVTYDE